jgi:site-specific recombinase XerD
VILLVPSRCLPNGKKRTDFHSIAAFTRILLQTHLHATELINDGVSLNTIRKRLGHQHIQTTLRYAEQTDAVADAELRARRRRKERGG